MKNINEMTDAELLKFVKKHGGQTDKLISRDTGSISSYNSVDLDKLESLKLELLEFAKDNNFPEKTVYFSLDMEYAPYSDSQHIACYLTSTERVQCSRKELEESAKQIALRLDISNILRINLKRKTVKTVKISI